MVSKHDKKTDSVVLEETEVVIEEKPKRGRKPKKTDDEN